jgi:hypothetical protein
VRPAALALGLLLCRATGYAQVQGKIDAGVGAPGAWSVAPQFRLEGSKARIDLTGEYRDLGGSGHGATGVLSGSFFRPLRGPLTVELAGTTRAQAGAGLRDAVAWEAGPKLHLHRADRGVWLGLQGGADPFGATLRWEAAAWRRVGGLSIQVQGWQTLSRLVQRSASPLRPPSDTLAPPDEQRLGAATTTELGGWLHWNRRHLEFAAATGVRLGPAGTLEAPGNGPGAGPRSRARSTSAWWQAEGTWWLADRWGIAGTVGRQPVDPVFDTPERNFLRLGIRAGLGGRRAATTWSAPRQQSGFRSRRMSPALVEFTLAAPGAGQVEIMGDFTDWSPVPMEQKGGMWRVRLPASPGLHRANIRWDGGAWRAPPATRVVQDEFGQQSGEFLVD